MTRPRVIEQEGVTGEFTVESYDRMMRGLMEKGYLDTTKLLKAGIVNGTALEIGPGPGYLGIDWLTKTTGTHLTGLDMSADMLAAARKNAEEFRVEDRVEYVLGNARQILSGEATFDAVFSNGSLHEWTNPEIVMNEIFRVLKPGGIYYISDLRRDIQVHARLLIQIAIPKERRPGFLSSLNASYTTGEIIPILKQTRLRGAKVTRELWTLTITGTKL
jgi:ubiquinone/menaquinone biosynthesis C-methylase UbiE